MQFLILLFLLLFAVPMGCVMWLLPASALARIALIVGGSAVLFGVVLLLPRLLRPLFRRRTHAAVGEIVASLAWPRTLSGAEMENFCVAWLETRHWIVSHSTGTADHPEDVYLLATRAGVRVAILCDRQGELLNPAAIRAFALGAAPLAADHRVLLTLVAGKLPSPAEAAATLAGVMLLQVPNLAELDALAKPVDFPVA